MKYILLVFITVVISVGCNKNGSNSYGPLVVYAPVAVSKQITSKKVFAHIVPWFETPATNKGTWGYHWTFGYTDPNRYTNIADTERDIASYYYPMIGPYASGDTSVIDYQLLLMKLSGIDGVFIDWYGTSTNANQVDNSQLRANTLQIISRIGKVGLKYAIVYEDQALSNYDSANTILWGKADMNYMQNHFFSDPNYETVSGKPLLLNFGPQHINSGSDWDTIFSVLPVPPAFYILWFTPGAASSVVPVASGEFSWVDKSNTSSLNVFYSGSTYSGSKITSAYPGFNSYYAAAGINNGITFTIPYTAGSQTTFQQTLNLALQQSGSYLQIATWDDYGEGTMIEPTKEFGYSYLTTLQQTLQVSSLSQSDLEAVTTLYQLRANAISANNANELAKLNQAFYYMVSLQMDKAKSLLN